MFEKCARPRVYGVPLGADFAKEFLAGLQTRLATSDPVCLARVLIIVNTRRLERRLTELLAQNGPCLMPKIVPIAQIADAFPSPTVLPKRPPLQRKLELMQLIEALLAKRPDLAPRSSVAALADSLSVLFDEIQADGIPADRLTRLDVADASEHWQSSLEFLKIASNYLARREDGLSDGEERQRSAVLALVERWKSQMPKSPVIVAGSTGSRATTLSLMEAVLKLPQGAVVLPGLDFDQPEHAWEALGKGASNEDHPQARFKKLFSLVEIPPKAVKAWTGVVPNQKRNRLVSLALRPAPVTNAWMREGPALGDLFEATAEMDLIEAPSPIVEAHANALRIRQALADDQTVALITPNRTLARQVTAALGRWGVEPDDSAGVPLSLSPPGRLLIQLASLNDQSISASDLIILLKHPLTASETQVRGEHLLLTREFELWLRRKACMKPAPDDVRAWATGFKSEVSDWANWVAAFIEKVSNPFPNSMEKKLSAHIALAEFLARGLASNGSGGLWEENAGVEAIEAINELRESALTAQDISGADYFSVFATALNSKEVRNPVRPDPRVMIWGTLEARVQSADLVILAGLNEGVWPEQPTPDPWLNRAMRSDVGLSSPDRRIGLSAHDFQQAIASRHVVLSRSTKDDDAATVPSRWLNRILNLTEGLPAQRGKEAVDAMRMRGQIWVEMAKSIDHRAPVRPAVLRPAPKPPLDARPRELTVTEIKTLLRDPYAIYARRVLRLRKINSLDCKPDHALRGTVLHAVVERFLSDRVDVFAADAKDQLLKIARRTLSELVIWPETQQLWYARIVAIAEGFLQNEKLRRSVGTPFPPEQSGKLELAAERFVLRGKADRIDLLNDGQLAIYDYKSGQVPSPKQVRLFDRQLSLEAIMAEEGCFSDVPKAPVAHVGYISLSPSHHDKNYDVRGTELSPEATLHEFKALIQAFDQRERGYTSRRAVPEMSFEGDFDQLARFGEWDESDPPSPEEVG